VIESTFDTSKLHGYTMQVAAGARVDIMLTGNAGTVRRVYGARVAR